MVVGKCVKVNLTFEWVGENGKEFKKYINIPMYNKKNEKKIKFCRIYMKTHQYCHLNLYHATTTQNNSFK